MAISTSINVRFLVLHKSSKLITPVRSSVQTAFSREAVDYILTKLNVTKLIQIIEEGVYGVDEIFSATLNANEIIGLPGGFTTQCLDKNLYFTSPIRFSLWSIDPDCHSGYYRHDICIFGVEDLKYLSTLKHFFANKMLANFDFGAVECMLEEVHRRTYHDKNLKLIDFEYYQKLAHVRYNKRKKEKKSVKNFDCIGTEQFIKSDQILTRFKHKSEIKNFKQIT